MGMGRFDSDTPRDEPAPYRERGVQRALGVVLESFPF
jgi:hypothetical protein